MRWGRPLLSMGVAVAVASCGAFGDNSDGDNPSTPTSGDAGSGPDATSSDGSSPLDGGGDAGPTYAASCPEVQKQGVLTDGDQTIDVDGTGPRAPFKVYCANMAGGGEVDTYLPLAQTADPGTTTCDTGTNTSCWRQGGSCTCPDTIRAYTKVRLLLDQSPVQLYINDVRYSSTNRAAEACDGDPSCQEFVAPAINLGVATGCGTTGGRGNLDLTGTPFHILAAETGMSNGGSPAGTTTYSADRKTVTTTSGGNCTHQFPGHASNTLDIEFD